MALFALTFAVVLLAVGGLAVGRLWNGAPLRSCRCDAPHELHACVGCPLRETRDRGSSAAGRLER